MTIAKVFFCVVCPLLSVGRGAEFVVDCSQRIGTVRPLHGVNNGPLNEGETVNLSADYRELGSPLARLHDCEWPNPDVVDIHAVFPDMSKDPTAAENYTFSRTDDYIQAIIDTGTGIVYRLGESIEHSRKKYHVHPPQDVEKWARVCLGIVRHYNEGWANGFHHNIRYWEIWNEPENRPSMWTGTDEQFFRMYAVAARRLKETFPELKVGGPSIGAPGETRRDSFEASDFLKAFLGYCREHGAPLDFFSWHTYTDDPWLYGRKARALRTVLDQYGFGGAEMHLNEWNYLPDNDWRPMLDGQGIVRQRWYEKMGGAGGAAFVATALMDLQDSPVDVANYYCGDTNAFGLFNRFGVPKKTYYAMKAFSLLARMPVRVPVSGGQAGEGPVVCAAMNQEATELGVLTAHYRGGDGPLRLRIDGFGRGRGFEWEMSRIDADRDLERVSSGVADTGQIEMPLEAPAVILFRCYVSQGASEAGR